jgi:hypothetical protein
MKGLAGLLLMVGMAAGSPGEGPLDVDPRTGSSRELAVAVGAERRARANLIAAERDLRRQKQLFEVGEGSRDYENARDLYERAKADEARALQRIRALREVLARIRAERRR